MTRADRRFCSALSREHSESMYGTAPRVATWLLIEYPLSWRPRAIPDSDLPPEVKLQLDRYATTVPRSRQLFIRQGHRRTSRVRCFVVRSEEMHSQAVRVDLTGYGPLGVSDLATIADGAEAQAEEMPFYAVCTHGTHDRCCAKFGRPVYYATREQVGTRAWECSHVGGDRFAGNLICFPQGIYYGHVTPDDVPAIIAAHTEGSIYLEKFRGRSCYTRVAQIGEYFLRRESGRTRISDFRLINTTQLGDARWGAQFEAVGQGTLHQLEFRATTDELCAYLTCDASAAKPVPQYELTSYSVGQSHSPS